MDSFCHHLRVVIVLENRVFLPIPHARFHSFKQPFIKYIFRFWGYFYSFKLEAFYMIFLKMLLACVNVNKPEIPTGSGI